MPPQARFSGSATSARGAVAQVAADRSGAVDVGVVLDEKRVANTGRTLPNDCRLVADELAVDDQAARAGWKDVRSHAAAGAVENDQRVAKHSVGKVNAGVGILANDAAGDQQSPARGVPQHAGGPVGGYGGIGQPEGSAAGIDAVL